MSSDEPADQHSDDTADSDDSSDSDEEEEDDSRLSALKRFQDSIVSRWNGISKSANKVAHQFHFLKQLQERYLKKKGESAGRVHDFLYEKEEEEEEEEEDDEEEPRVSSDLREIYIDTFPKKLSCILEAEEGVLEEETRLRRLHIKRRFHQFTSTLKKKTKLKKTYSREESIKKGLQQDEKSDEEEYNFEFYVKQEKARRQKLLKTKEAAELKDKSGKKTLVTPGKLPPGTNVHLVTPGKLPPGTNVRSTSTKVPMGTNAHPTTDKLPSGTNVHSCKQNQPLPRRYTRTTDSKNKVDRGKLGIELTTVVNNKKLSHTDRKDENILLKPIQKSAGGSTGVARGRNRGNTQQPTKERIYKDGGKTFSSTAIKRTQQAAARKPLKVETQDSDEHSELLLLGQKPLVRNAERGIHTKIYKAKEFEGFGQVDSLPTAQRRKVDIKKEGLELYDNIKQLQSNQSSALIKKTHTAVVSNNESVEKKQIGKVVSNNDNHGQSNNWPVIGRQIALARARTNEESIVSQTVPDKFVTQVSQSRQVSEPSESPSKRTSEKTGSEAAATETVYSNQANLIEKHNVTEPEQNITVPHTTESNSEYEEGVMLRERLKQTNQHPGFAGLLPSLRLLRLSKIWPDKEVESSDAVPPVSIFRGNKSLSDTIFKIKLRARKQMRTQCIEKLSLQEPILSSCEHDTAATSNLIDVNTPMSQIEEAQPQQMCGSFNTGLRKITKPRKEFSEYKEDWQRIASFDFIPDEDYYEETKPLPTPFSKSTFSRGSFFDLLYKIKWKPKTHFKKKLQEDDTLIFERNFYSPDEYMDKFGVPVRPHPSSGIQVEEDFTFENAWQKTINQANEEASDNSVVELLTKSMSNVLRDRQKHVRVETIQLVTEDHAAYNYNSEQSATSQLRRSSKGSKAYIVNEDSSSSRNYVELDPSSLRRPKTFVLVKSANRADDNEEDDDDSDEEDSDSDESDSSEEEENEEEEMRPRDQQIFQEIDETDGSDSSKNKNVVTTKTSKIVERIVSMFSLSSIDGTMDIAQVLDVDALDNVPDEHVEPESIIITDIKPDGSKLDPAFNICVDLKARRKEALTKLLIRATGNKYMTEYFRLEIEKRAETNDEFPTTSKNGSCIAKLAKTSKSFKADKSLENVPKTSLNNDSNSFSVVGMEDLLDPKDSMPISLGEKNNLTTRLQRKVSKDED